MDYIKAKVIKDSICWSGNRMITFEIEYPRFITAEINTHCMLEKNSASSRAIPVETVIDLIQKSPAMPVHWGQNNPGMVSKTELDFERKNQAISVWLAAMEDAIRHAKQISDKHGINAHKQISNRLLEPFATMKTVITGTEWANFFWLRNHPDAQPEFKHLAEKMQIAMNESVPQYLNPGQWHLPYVDLIGDEYFVDGEGLSLHDAIKTSASCCAQTSYRKLNTSIEQTDKVFGMLNLGSSDAPAHASPTTHQATPMNPENVPFDPLTWQNGITHVRRNGTLWSGKLRGWVQYRQLIENEAVWQE